MKIQNPTVFRNVGLESSHAGSSRIIAIDLTKGILIVLILAYHSLNYSDRYYLGFRYLGFLPISFIFVTGFLIARVYSGRFSTQGWHSTKRLMRRSLKLILLFTLLNITLAFSHLSGKGTPTGVSDYFSHWKEIYITGQGRFASFQVLLPIAYFLLIAPALLQADALNRWVLPTTTIILIGFCTAMDGNSLAILMMVSAGLPGILLGNVVPETWVAKPSCCWASLLGYACIFSAGRAWGQTYLVQLLEAGTGVAFIYSLCSRIHEGSGKMEWLVNLGRHSLLAYVLQIGILQAMVRLTGHPSPLSTRFLLLICGGGALMTVMIQSIACTREKSKIVDRIYKLGFA